jgi:uncharacterized protein YcfJ
MSKLPAAAIALAAALAAGQATAQVTFYEYEGMRGRWFIADQLMPNLDHYGFNDRASSAVVQRGSWEVCEHADFGGRCVVLSPGQYPSLGSFGLNNQVSSIRRIGGGRPVAMAPPVVAGPPVVAPPPVERPYSYYPQHGEPLYEANVVSVRAVTGPPEQRCWVERQQVGGGSNVPGAIVGGILGGVLGHQIGNGRGNDVATAVGAVTGAAVGANVNRGGGYTQDVQRCSSAPGYGGVQYWDVTYEFRGRYHRAQFTYAPGPSITVNGRGEPRG